jgi:hypothetical protein
MLKFGPDADVVVSTIKSPVRRHGLCKRHYDECMAGRLAKFSKRADELLAGDAAKWLESRSQAGQMVDQQKKSPA